MSINSSVELGLLEGRTYTLGREGHIYINSPSVSKQHAEIKIIDGRVHLRDLNSTNGTYLVKNKGLVDFEEGFVNLLQPIVIGEQRYTIQSLLLIASKFVASDDNTTLLDFEQQKVSNLG